MHFHPQNKYSMFYKYDLSIVFLERDIKAMQKSIEKMGHMKVPKYRKKGGHNEGPKMNSKNDEHMKAHEKNKTTISQIQKLEKEILSKRGV
jgi:hypothetical protein